VNPTQRGEEILIAELDFRQGIVELAFILEELFDAEGFELFDFLSELVKHFS